MSTKSEQTQKIEFDIIGSAKEIWHNITDPHFWDTTGWTAFKGEAPPFLPVEGKPGVSHVEYAGEVFTTLGGNTGEIIALIIISFVPLAIILGFLFAKIQKPVLGGWVAVAGMIGGFGYIVNKIDPGFAKAKTTFAMGYQDMVQVLHSIF